MQCTLLYLAMTHAVGLTPHNAYILLANASHEYHAKHKWLHGALPYQHEPMAPTVTVFDHHDTRAQPFSNVSCFRVPSLVTVNRSTLLAFAEARIGASCGDCLPTGIVSKRSTDGGLTWGAMRYVVPPTALGGNPTTFVDRGEVWLHYVRTPTNTSRGVPTRCNHGRTNWQRHSTDGGRTWDAPTNLTTALRTYAGALSGPGNGVAYNTSYRVPMHYDTAEQADGRDVVLASDDRGRTWTVHTSDTLRHMDEASLVAINASHWAMYMRNAHRNASCNCKARALSTDGGRTWDGTPLVYEPQLVDPVCQGSATRIGDELFYVTPTYAYARTALTVFRTRVHDVNPRTPSTWTAHGVTDETVYAGYSAMTDQWLGNRTVGVLWTACDVPLPFRVWCGVGWTVRFSRVRC